MRCSEIGHFADNCTNRPNREWYRKRRSERRQAAATAQSLEDPTNAPSNDEKMPTQEKDTKKKGPYVTCFRCKEFGDHRAFECTKKPDRSEYRAKRRIAREQKEEEKDAEADVYVCSSNENNASSRMKLDEYLEKELT